MSLFLLLLDPYPAWKDAILFLLAGQMYVIGVLWLLSQVCHLVGFTARKVSPAEAPVPVPAASSPPVAAPPADGGLPSVLAAVIAAAVAVSLDRPARILSIQPSTDVNWAREGRRDHFSSHRVR